MSDALQIAQHYFELSNKSDLDNIAKLFTNTTTYSSQTTGVYLGVDDIIAMQRTFHGKFAALHWQVNSAYEVKPGIVLFDFDFTGRLPSGKEIKSSGLEYVIVQNRKIQHVEIRNKPVAIKDRTDDAVHIAPDLHEIIFENNQLRVLKVTVKPGAKAATHWHPENINYILTSGKLRFSKPEGTTIEVELTDGQVTSSPAGSHAVENVGNTEVQTVQVELKSLLV